MIKRITKILFFTITIIFSDTAFGNLEKQQLYSFEGSLDKTINIPISIKPYVQKNIDISINNILDLDNFNILIPKNCKMKCDASEQDLSFYLRATKLICTFKKDVKVYKIVATFDLSEYKLYIKSHKSSLFSDKITKITLPKNTKVTGRFYISNIITYNELHN